MVHLAMPMVVTVLILFFTLLLLSVEVVVVHGLVEPDTLAVLGVAAVVIQEQVERVHQVKGTMVDQEPDQALPTSRVAVVAQVKQVTLTDKCLEGTDYPVIFLVQLFFMQVEEEVVAHRIKEQVEQEVVVQELFREQGYLEQQTLEVVAVQEIKA